MRPQIRDGISVLYREIEGRKFELNFLVESTSTILPFAVDKHTLACVRLFDGSRTVAQIAQATGVASHAVEQLVSEWADQAILVDGANIVHLYQKTRFETQANFFAGFETAGRRGLQASICNAHVAILGVGGIGTWIAQGLVQAGVQKLTLIDPDQVELANLNRQALFTPDDIGQTKISALRRRLLQLDPELCITEVCERLETADDCVAVAQNVDLFVSCADEPGTDEVNRLVSGACYPLGISHILCGGYDGHLGFVGPTIVPDHAGCWFCYEQTLEHQLRTAGYQHLQITQAQIKGGNLGAISAIIANYHVLEALKVVSGFAQPTLLNQVAELDFLTYNIHKRPYRQQPSCRVCGTGKDT